MDSALKGLLLAAGVLLTCMILGLGFYIAREAQATAGVSANRLHDYRVELEEGDLLRYDGLTVSGNEVVNMIKRLVSKYKEGEDAPVRVRVALGSAEWVYRNKTGISELRNKNSSRFISPQKEYNTTIKRDENDVIIELIFRQQ